MAIKNGFLASDLRSGLCHCADVAKNNTSITLKDKADASKWLVDEDMLIKSQACHDMVLTEDRGQECHDGTIAPRKPTCHDRLTTGAGNVIAVKPRATVGGSHQKWSTKPQTFSSLAGPFSFILRASNSGTSATAIGIADSSCAIGTLMQLQSDSHTDPRQQFYTSTGGVNGFVIQPTECVGLSVVPPTDCSENPLSLGVAAVINDAKWKFEGEYLVSTKCDRKVIGVRETIHNGSRIQSIMLVSLDPDPAQVRWIVPYLRGKPTAFCPPG